MYCTQTGRMCDLVDEEDGSCAALRGCCPHREDERADEDDPDYEDD
jgi:hypothetical protein